MSRDFVRLGNILGSINICFIISVTLIKRETYSIVQQLVRVENSDIEHISYISVSIIQHVKQSNFVTSSDFISC